ncbi:MAG TPA: BON domain-containing protein [Terriglobales bacterium]|nr:BON domain-containing protein [Terriglobales bacterium]
MKRWSGFVAGLLAMALVAGLLAAVPARVLATERAFAVGQDKDAEAKARVEQSFKESGLLIGNDIQVVVGKNAIALTGTVRTLAEKEKAGHDAAAAAKGYKVVNSLALAESGRSAREIGDAVMSAIEKSPSYFIYDLVGPDVTPTGEVTLKGWTSYPWSATEFVKLAQAQPGVTKVRNDIQRLLMGDADRNLRTFVAQLIYTRPTGPSFPRSTGAVHIVVINGVVTLGGTVEKQADAESYERLIRLNTGALNVNNGLRVRQK